MIALQNPAGGGAPLKQNLIPESVKTIHFIAICGTAMGALAAALTEMGFSITGSDANVYPPMSTFLEKRGILVSKGFDGGHLAYRPDLVIVGNAVRRENPEVQRMYEMGLPYCSMPQAINRFLASGKNPLVITGTHGKTTTSAIVAWLLESDGRDPSFMIGGILNNFNANYRVGRGREVVLEGDEYDTAFFDKGAKFFHYAPHIAVLTSVEFDHADIFRDLTHVMDTFDRFISGISPDGTLIAYDRDANIDRLVAGKKCIVQRYGHADGSFWRLGDTAVAPPWNEFDVIRDGRFFGRFRTQLVGGHNRLNALAAVAVADQLGISAPAIAKGLETFAGVKRRQEIRGVKNGITVIDDFAHHPTAVRETTAAVRSFYPDHRLIAVFEPRTNTSMRSVFQRVYPDAFDGADFVCIRKPPLLEKVPENERFSSEQLVADLSQKGQDARFFEDTDAILSFLRSEARSGDIVLIMSNGGFDNIHERLLAVL